MQSLDAITLKAFLGALMRLDNSLPTDLQDQLNEIGKAFPSDVSKLHALAKDYSPLAQEYMEARCALQDDGEPHLNFTLTEPNYSAQSSDEQIMDFAKEVFNNNDSVNLVKKAATESSGIGQILFQLRHQTSFMVKNAQNIPEEELWIWRNPIAWGSLERGLKQAAVGKGRYLGDFAQYADLEIED